jgi:hypothetical protein
MKSINILNEINFESLPTKGFRLIEYEKNYWGRDNKGNLVFAVKEETEVQESKFLNTKYLKLFINNLFDINGGVKKNERFTVLVLESEIDFEREFIEIVLAYLRELKHISLIDFFIRLSSLLSQESKANKIELIGLYGELLLLRLLYKTYNLNLVGKYQSVDKLLFDFSISEKLKIEVKSTTNDQRIHHIRLNQVYYENIKVFIASIILKKDDSGTSLKELIESVISDLSPSLDFIVLINSKLKNWSDDEINNIRFNELIGYEKIKFFDSKNISRLLGSVHEENIFNIEFDVNLSTIDPINFSEIMDLIEVKNESSQ